MKYWYIVYQGQNGGFGNFCTHAEGDFNIVDAHKAAEIAANGFAAIMSWKEITKIEHDEFGLWVKRLHVTEGDSVQ